MKAFAWYGLAMLTVVPSLGSEGILEIELGKCQQRELAFRATGFPDVFFVVGTLSDGLAGGLAGSLIFQDGKLRGSMHHSFKKCDTGIPAVDELILNTLETTKWPKATLKIDPVSIPIDLSLSRSGDAKLPFHGTLSLHGVEHPIIGQLEIEQGESVIELKFSFNVSLSDYGVAPPLLSGTGIRNEVQVISMIQASRSEVSPHATPLH